jgi:DNA repair photolyase
MIKEIRAKTILNTFSEPDDWFGIKYNMNLYRGCQHQCIYCDSRSECYRIENFNDMLVKVNAVELLEKELSRKRLKGTIGTGSMNDPYMPVEEKYNLVGQALEVVARYRFPLHVITKSDRVLRDLDTLVQINRVYAAVSFTITTTDDRLAKILEPGAPPPSARLAAMKELAKHGILTGVTMMPVLPFIEDTAENVRRIIQQAHENGASYILPCFGMSLRDRQRDYYYRKLDIHFPGIKTEYLHAFGNQYRVSSPCWRELQALCDNMTDDCGISQQMPKYAQARALQMQLI